MDIKKILQHWPDLKNIQKLASGGQKIVYKAYSKEKGAVVVKLISGSSERGLREIQIVKEHNIPQAPKILDYADFSNTEETCLVLLEEFVDGHSLQDTLDRNQTFSIEQVISLLDFLLGTIAQLEAIKIIHRDIKPANILLSNNNEYKLIDFGIARDLKAASLTATSDSSPCTPGYAAPELFSQNAKSKITSKVDLFSAGVVSYVMLTGKNPYIRQGATIFDIAMTTTTIPTPMLTFSKNYDEELFKFIRLLMSKQAFKRPPSAAVAYSWFKTISTNRKNAVSAEKEEQMQEKIMGDFLE